MAEEDLIFGKNRHFFGGIEPSNMLAFSGQYSGSSVLITATLPADTTINGQTLCTVQGAVIRRRGDNYPKDEFDGDLVATITSSTVFSDSSVLPNGTYYYSAFPFTAQGVYNRNKSNRFVVNEPEAMVEFTATSSYEAEMKKAKVAIKATLPDGAAGAVIRKSSVSYPISETDGDEFENISSSGTYYDENVEVNITYYYSAFPYTSTGAYNRSESNRASVLVTEEPPKPSRTYLYGFDIDLNDPNPSTRVSYPEDVDNYEYAPVTNVNSNFGDWSKEAGVGFMPRPCCFDTSNNFKYYLNPNDYSKTIDGEDSGIDGSAFPMSDVKMVMVEWPKIYMKRTVSDGVYSFRCSDVKIDDDYECWCNYDYENNETDHFYTSVYPMTDSQGKCLSNVRTYCYDGSSYSDYTLESISSSLSRANGSLKEFSFITFSEYSLINDLLIMMCKSTNIYTIYGRITYSEPYTTGSGNYDGMFRNGTKVFGMEYYFYAGSASPVDGMKYYPDRDSICVKATPGTKDGSTVVGYDTDFKKWRIYYSNTRISGIYVKTYDTVESFGRFVTDLGSDGGSSTTYEIVQLTLEVNSPYASVMTFCTNESSSSKHCSVDFKRSDVTFPYHCRISYVPKAVVQ